MKAARKHYAGIAARTHHEKLYENNKAKENSESNMKQTRQNGEAQARSVKPRWNTLKATRKRQGKSHHHQHAFTTLIIPFATIKGANNTIHRLDNQNTENINEKNQKQKQVYVRLSMGRGLNFHVGSPPSRAPWIRGLDVQHVSSRTRRSTCGPVILDPAGPTNGRRDGHNRHDRRDGHNGHDDATDTTDTTTRRRHDAPNGSIGLLMLEMAINSIASSVVAQFAADRRLAFCCWRKAFASTFALDIGTFGHGPFCNTCLPCSCTLSLRSNRRNQAFALLDPCGVVVPTWTTRGQDWSTWHGFLVGDATKVAQLDIEDCTWVAFDRQLVVESLRGSCICYVSATLSMRRHVRSEENFQLTVATESSTQTEQSRRIRPRCCCMLAGPSHPFARWERPSSRIEIRRRIAQRLLFWASELESSNDPSCSVAVGASRRRQQDGKVGAPILDGEAASGWWSSRPPWARLLGR